MEPVLTTLAGLGAGVLLKKAGVHVKLLGAVVLACIAWVVCLLVLAAAINQPMQPTWVGFASLTFAVGLAITVRTK
jgi:hypothetical protein